MIFLVSRCLHLCCLLFCLLLGCAYAGNVAQMATVGTDVTLTCTYDAHWYGRLSVCWGRGPVPNSGCSDEVIKSDGTSVTSRLSERYLFMGNTGEGDVSLTIRQVEESDSGVYGCRVEIPGWFNDQKHEVTLSVIPVPPNPVTVKTLEVKERTITVRWSSVFDGGRPITSYMIDVKKKRAPWDLTKRTTVSHELTQVTLVDLRPAENYNLRVFAVNSVGMSEASDVLTFVTKEGAPEGPPLDMKLEALTSRSIRVTWKPPRSDLRNGVLRSYSIGYKEYDPTGRQFRQWKYQTVAATQELESFILSNLKPSTMYSMRIQAKTSAGIGPTATAPPCQTLNEIAKTSAPVTMTSTSPVATTSAPVTMTSTSPAATDTSTSFIADYTTSTAVTAATTWGPSPSSASSVHPDPPVVMLKEVIDNTISLFWTRGFERGTPITGYLLEYKAVNASWDYTKTVVDFSPNQTEATIIETNPSTYNIRMFAVTSLGTSKASNVLTITTGEAGHQRDVLSTTPSHVTVNAQESQSGHLVAIVVTVVLVLVLLIVAIVMIWQFRQRKGNLNILLTNGTIRYVGSDTLQEA